MEVRGPEPEAQRRERVGPGSVAAGLWEEQPEQRCGKPRAWSGN